jgi:zona occludens toxin (predicted ATPase)
VRRSKEIMVLLALLLGMMGFVVWYVIDRRAKMRAAPAAAGQPAGQVPADRSAGSGPSAAPVDLTQHDNQTIDFSSGRPVVKDSAADRAAIEQAKKDMAEAVKGVTFGPPAKPAAPPPAPPAEPAKP